MRSDYLNLHKKLHANTMLAKDFKRGTILNYNGAPCMIENITVQTPSARGATTLYKFRARNLVTKNKVDFTFKGTDNLEEADFKRRNVTFSYSEPTAWHFMDAETYEMYDLTPEDVGDDKNYITESLEGMQMMFYNDEPIGLTLPASVVLKVIKCDPGVRGNSATSRAKPATVETGFEVMVPEYLEEGEMIKIDTRTGEYSSRA